LTGAGGASSVAGGATTSAVSVFNTGAQNAAIANPGSFTAGGAFAGAGIGALTGAVADAILGGRGDPTRNAIFSAIGGAIGSIWGPIGSVVGGAIGSLVDNVFGGAKKLERATITLNASSNGFFALQETVISKQKAFFGGKSRKTKVTDVSGDFAAVAEEFGNFARGLVATAEALGGASDFISTFTTKIDINVKGKKDKVAERIQAAIEDLFRQAQVHFVNNVEGLSDRVMAVLNMFKSDIDNFALAFEAVAGIENLFNLDLVEAAAKATADSQISLSDAYANSLEQYREVILAYDGSLASLQELTTATAIFTEIQIGLITVYQQLGAEISSMFQSSAQAVREALMSEEELYNFRQARIDELIEAASTTTDPEELNRLAQEIDRLGLASFNSLDDEQMQALGPEFIEFFDNMDDFFGGRIDEGIGSIVQDQAALDIEVSSKIIATAADIQLAAAQEFRRGVDADRENRLLRNGLRADEMGV